MKKSLKYISAAVVAVMLGACQDFVEDLDVDPNSPASADATNTIQGVMLADIVFHEGDVSRTTGMWAGQFTGSDRQYLSTDIYSVTAGTFDDLWATAYVGTITQARLTEATAEAGFNLKLKGVAQILEAHAAGTTTSLWGDIPFREAGQRATFPSPKYDPQAQVYADVQALLDDAIKNLAAGGVIPATQDIFYAGNATKWTALAYSLKARYYLHTKEYAAAKAAAARGISSAANDFVAPHANLSGAQNLYYQFLGNRNGYLTGDNAYAPKLLDPAQKSLIANNRNNAKTDEGARFSYFYEPASTPAAADYELRQGLTATAKEFSDPDASFPLVTYSETQLIIAETSARTGTPVDALAALNRHRAALAVAYPTGKYEPLLLSDIAGGDLLKEILTERYVTLIGQAEAFTDARRTNNIVGIPIKGTGNTTLPQRFLYPQSEVNANANVPNPIPGLFVKTPVNN
ncbi:SusD/RagB family nutrient-binding outer membrane lipoprotein [Hymenobacter sp. AT01-02]|uniref:SusD/RagB family nutrient-binding outer membrane lipoprotein n=1 Tax=Hymenobacter sp. AT01-02 TaxID=1571877 RepID=UPI0005F17F33|nr:SusD/RagB family nutrient-binding outer membrane lipoprotein [Hymenobacter sp. AT01-02]